MNHEESCKVLCAKTYSTEEIKQFAEKAIPYQLPQLCFSLWVECDPGAQ